MTDKILENYQRFREGSLKDIEHLSKYSNRELNLRFKEGKWSVNQVLLHLLSVEKAVLAYVKRKSQAEDLQKAGLKSWLRSKTLKLFLRLPMRFKAPVQLPEPSENGMLEEIMAEMLQVRSQMEDFICKIPPRSRRDLIFRHPRAGMLSLSQTITFLHDHWGHHKKQIEDLEARIIKNKLLEQIY